MALLFRPRAYLPFTLVLLAGPVALSCAWMGDPPMADPEDCVQVLVDNQSFSDMNVFVERDGRLFRLGTVMSKQAAPFLLTHRMLGGATAYRLVADPIGSLEKIRTQPIRVERDARTYWTLEPTGWLSHVVVR